MIEFCAKVKFIFFRMFSSLSSKKDESTLDTHKEEDSDENAEPGSLKTERNEDLETSAKVSWAVRLSEADI